MLGFAANARHRSSHGRLLDSARFGIAAHVKEHARNEEHVEQRDRSRNDEHSRRVFVQSHAHFVNLNNKNNALCIHLLSVRLSLIRLNIFLSFEFIVYNLICS